MLRVAVGPSSQKVVTHTLMQQASALARRYPGVRLHTHLAENTVSTTPSMQHMHAVCDESVAGTCRHVTRPLLLTTAYLLTRTSACACSHAGSMW